MDQADPEIENHLKQYQPSTNASILLRSATSIDVAYAVFGLDFYTGLQNQSEPKKCKLLFTSEPVSINIPRPSGWFTAQDNFIPAANIVAEEALFEKLKGHFSTTATSGSVFSYDGVEAVPNKFDMYTYKSQVNAAAAKSLGNNGGAGRGFDLIQVNEELLLPPLIR
jgi:hypothetical protein